MDQAIELEQAVHELTDAIYDEAREGKGMDWSVEVLMMSLEEVLDPGQVQRVIARFQENRHIGLP